MILAKSRHIFLSRIEGTAVIKFFWAKIYHTPSFKKKICSLNKGRNFAYIYNVPVW